MTRACSGKVMCLCLCAKRGVLADCALAPARRIMPKDAAADRRALLA
jgi:hypothetical protein